MSLHGKRVLAIAHEPDGQPGQIAVRMAERGMIVETHLVTADYDQPQEATAFPDWRDYDVLLPMGSVRSVVDKDQIDTWIYDELRLLREAHAADCPILGICFGGQLLADALGGSAEHAPVDEIGWFDIHEPDSGANPAGPGPWFEWHHDRFTAPPDAQVLAESERATQLFRIGRTVGTQFHPEVDVDHITGFLNGSELDYLQQHGIDRDTMLAEAAGHQSAAIARAHRFVDWFLDEVAFG